MAFFKRKSVIITICVLVATFVFSAVSLIAVNAFQNNKHQPNLIVDAVYTYNDSSKVFESNTDSNYTSNSDFYITTPIGLINFSISVAYGCTFEGKKVYLSNDINMSGHNFPPIGGSMNGTTYYGEDGAGSVFMGEFNGQGFTVSNIITTIEDTGVGNNYGIGFFAALSPGAIVKNLRIKNFNVKITDNDGYAYVGGIVGRVLNVNKLPIIIENCAVDGFKIDSLVKDSDYAGIFGYASGNVDGIVNVQLTNILLKDFTTTGDGCTSDRSSVNSISCSAMYSLNNYSIQGTSAAINNSNPNANKNAWDSSTKKFPSDDATLRSSIGGEDKSIPWYYASDYNGGYPYLRDFISWSTIYMSAGDDGTVDKTSIQIPSDAFEMFYNYFTGTTTNSATYNSNTTTATATVTSNPISIYGQEVKPEALAGYVFSNWTVNISRSVTWKWVQLIQPMAALIPKPEDGTWVPTYGIATSVTITANFTEETYKFKFANTTIDGITYSPKGASEITAKFGQTITVSVSHTASKTTITYKIDSNTITYPIASKYTIQSYGSIDGTAINNEMTVPDLIHNQTYTITPTIQLRQHNSVFN